MTVSSGGRLLRQKTHSVRLRGVRLPGISGHVSRRREGGDRARDAGPADPDRGTATRMPAASPTPGGGASTAPAQQARGRFRARGWVGDPLRVGVACGQGEARRGESEPEVTPHVLLTAGPEGDPRSVPPRAASDRAGLKVDAGIGRVVGGGRARARRPGLRVEQGQRGRRRERGQDLADLQPLDEEAGPTVGGGAAGRGGQDELGVPIATEQKTKIFLTLLRRYHWDLPLMMLFPWTRGEKNSGRRW